MFPLPLERERGRERGREREVYTKKTANVKMFVPYNYCFPYLLRRRSTQKQPLMLKCLYPITFPLPLERERERERGRKRERVLHKDNL